YNQNSISETPPFVGLPDLHITSNDPPFTGEYVGLDEDVDGDSRCKFAPTVGADESQFPYPTPILSIGVLDSAFEGSLARIVSTFGGTASSSVNISWYVDGVWTDDKKNLDYIFPTAGNYDVAL